MDWPKSDTVNLISAIGSLLGGLGAGIAAWFSYLSIRTSRKEGLEERERSKPTFQFASLGVYRISRPVSEIEFTIILTNLRNRPIEKYRYAIFIINDDYPEHITYSNCYEYRGSGTTGNLELKDRYYDWNNDFVSIYPKTLDPTPIKLKHILFLVEIIDVYGMVSHQIFYLPMREITKYQGNLNYTTVIANDGATLTFNAFSTLPEKAILDRMIRILPTEELLDICKPFNIRPRLSRRLLLKARYVKMMNSIQIAKETIINKITTRKNKPEIKQEDSRK